MYTFVEGVLAMVAVMTGVVGVTAAATLMVCGPLPPAEQHAAWPGAGEPVGK
jgi:hypothetical protein